MAELRANLADLKLIIIDEISLVSADMLYTIHMRLKEVFNTPLLDLFANLDVVLVGDLLQIPPVQGTLVFKTPLTIKFQANKENLELWKSFQPMILKHNHRQGDEKEWADALNEFRVGIVSEKGETLLKERQTSDEFLVEDAMHIFYRNKNVKNHNEKMLKTIDSPLVSIRASVALPKGCYTSTDKDKGTIGSSQFQEVLNIKLGARVGMIYNVNTIDDLVNGASDTLIALEYNAKEEVECFIVRFDKDSAGQQQREKYPKYSEKYRADNGTPIFRESMDAFGKTKAGRKLGLGSKAVIHQFPFIVNYASTNHKIQVTCF